MCQSLYLSASNNLKASNNLLQEVIVRPYDPITITDDNTLTTEPVPYSFDVYRFLFGK